MLVQNSVYRNTYLTDGVNKDFYFSFPILEASQVLVQTSLLTDTDTVTTVDPSQYTVIGVGQTTGGHISFTTAPPTGSRLALTLNIPITQLYQYTELDSFPAKSHEDALAKLTLICQQLKEQISRAVTLPPTSSESPQDVMQGVYAARDEAKNLADNVQQWLNEVGTEVGDHSYVTATNTTTARTLANRFADVVNVKDFGALGDGTTDDTAAIQAAMNMGQGKCVYFPAGVYVISGEGVKMPSYCRVMGDGQGVSILHNKVAPVLQTPYENTVFQAALYADCGVDTVEICDLELRGPQYGMDYAINPLTWLLMNNAISIRGRYYQQRKNLPREGESHNVAIRNVRISGYGYAGIHVDQATNVHISDCDISYCTSFGIAFVGCKHFSATKNYIREIYPGNIENNTNRVYGITATRVYGNSTTDLLPDGSVNQDIASIYRRSQYGVLANNYVENCYTWKGLDTHGGKGIKFLGNTIIDCHIAIGTDMGGYLARHGYARVEDITISGNNCYRYAADRPDEGPVLDYGSARYATASAAIHCVAKDGAYDSDVNLNNIDLFGYNLHISNNNIFGWGEKGRNIGAVYVSNHKNVTISDNIIRNSRASAISSDGVLSNCIITGNVIRDVRLTEAEWTTPFARAFALSLTENTVSSCVVTDNTILNSLAVPLVGMDFSMYFGSNIEIGPNKYMNTGSGSIARYNSPMYVPKCYVTGELIAHGTIPSGSTVSNGQPMSTNNTYGVKSIKKYGVGVYDILLEDVVFSRSAADVSVTPIATGLGDMGYHGAAFGIDENGDQRLRITLRNKDGAEVDRSVYFSVRALAL